MDLITHYIDTVRPFLPRDQRDDIAEELEGAINDRIQDREAELGRRLKDAEVETELQRFGHPFMVAARYQPQQYLIGPTVFPLWWLAARLMVALAVLAVVARAGIILATARPDRMALQLFNLWPSFWGSALFMIGAVTVVAAIFERVPITWRARDLPNLNLNLNLAPSAPRPWPGPFAAWEHQAKLAGAALGLVLWILLPWLWSLAPAEAQPAAWTARSGVALVDHWWVWFYALLIVTGVTELVLQLAKWKAGPTAVLAARLIQCAVSLGFALVVVFAGPMLRVVAAPADPALIPLIQQLNRMVPLAGAAAAFGVLCNSGWAIWVWRRARVKA